MLSRTIRSSLLNARLSRAPIQPSLLRPSLALPSSSHFQKRFVANPNPAQPGSKTLDEAATNIKEELGGAAGEAAKMIRGTGPGNSEGPLKDDFNAITSDMVQAVPTPIMVWGLAGTVPYAATAALTAWTARTSTIAVAGGAEVNVELLQHLQGFQITYGAVILSFLGALHWGMEFSKFGGVQGHKRLALGVLPLAYAWPTLYMANPAMALTAQWGGFLFSWLLDRWAAGQGWTPRWFATYRFYLTLVVGSSLIATLAATNIWDPTRPKLAAHSVSPTSGMNHGKISLSKEEIDQLPVKVSTGTNSFVKFEKKEEEVDEEAEAEKTAEQGDKAERQIEKDAGQVENSPRGFKEDQNNIQPN